MQVTERHIEQYREEGYCLIEGLISVELMGAVRQRVGEIVAERPDWPEQHFQVLDQERYQSAKGEALPGGIQQPAEREEALRRFVALDEGERMRRWREIAEAMCAQLTGLAGVEAEIAYPTRGARPLVIPRARLRVDEGRLGCTVNEIEEELEQGAPAIAVLPEPAEAAIWLNPQHLADGEEEIVAQRVAEVLRAKV